MDAFKTYEYLALARRRLFSWVRALPAGDYTREFPIGQGTLARTLTHIATSEWYYVLRIERKPVPPDEAWPVRHENPPPFAALETVWMEQEARTRAALAAVRDWHAAIEYEVSDEGRRLAVSTSAADIFTQLVLHEVHHRSQAMTILRQLGVPLEDIDYNAFMYDLRDVGPA